MLGFAQDLAAAATTITFNQLGQVVAQRGRLPHHHASQSDRDRRRPAPAGHDRRRRKCPGMRSRSVPACVQRSHVPTMMRKRKIMRQSPPLKSPQQGVVLIEAMVAILIFSVGRAGDRRPAGQHDQERRRLEVPFRGELHRPVEDRPDVGGLPPISPPTSRPTPPYACCRAARAPSAAVASATAPW